MKVLALERAPSAFVAPAETPAWVRWPMEVVLWLMLVAAPWMYGAVHPGFELLLDVGLLILLALWAARMLWERQVVLARCPAMVLLAVFLLLALWQITPLPAQVLESVSPATADLYDRLMPKTAETFPPGTLAAEAPPAERTISLDAEATRHQCYHWLAILLVFAVVRNNLASPAVLTRLAVVMVVNGFALALFGIIQNLTSPSDTLYWTYQSLGRVFGPFVSRNMFPYYVNMCLGLGLGLVLARISGEPGEGQQPVYQRWPAVVSAWLHDVPSLWVLAAVGLMASAVAFSLSRGGIAAMLGGILFAAVVGRGRKGTRAGLAALACGVGLFFLAWLGIPAVEARMKTAFEPELADRARIPLWERVLPAVPEFPLWGTGLGTFRYVEVWKRGETPILPTEPGGSRALESVLFDHAHNDYVEIVVESGLPGLIVVLAILVLVYRSGLRLVVNRPGTPQSGLVVGALAGLTAVAIHSFVDFGMQAPAIALLTTVLCAMVTGLGSEVPNSQGRPTIWRLSLAGLAPVGTSAVLIMLGLILCAHSWRLHRVERLQAAAAQVPPDTPNRRLVQLPYLEAAARLAPRDPAIRQELAQAHLDLLQAEIASAQKSYSIGALADAFLMAPSVLVGMGASFPGVVQSAGWDAHWLARAELLNRAHEKALRQHLFPALAESIAARNANPLMPEPQLMLALYADALAGGESQAQYFDRVKFIAPRLPEVWFYSGLAALGVNDSEKTWQDWRKCLSVNDVFLDQIIFRAARQLPPDKLIAKVLPDQPDILVKAGTRLFPNDAQRRERLTFYRAALEAFKRQQQTPTLEQLKLKLQVERALGLFTDSLKTAREVVDKAPTDSDARMELAQAYYDTNQYAESIRELRIVQRSAPSNPKIEPLREALLKKGF
jgi:O-antigen ligase/tetratricopeptide (TPR) repeat protein